MNRFSDHQINRSPDPTIDRAFSSRYNVFIL
jgi:hypothetical protein